MDTSWVKAADGEVIAHAANGEDILSPVSTRTYLVTAHGGEIQVPHGMIYIPTGPSVTGFGSDAKNVTLPGFCIGKFDVTNAEYRAFLIAAGGRHPAPRYWRNGEFPPGKANHPVIFVSLADAAAYCAWVSQKTGWTISIPTAAQWEMAARGPNHYLYPWGNVLDTRYDDKTGKLTTRFNYNAVTAVVFLRDHGDEEATYIREESPYHGQRTKVRDIAAYDLTGRQTLLAVTASGSVRGWVNHDSFTGFIYTDVFQAIMSGGGNTNAVGAYPDGVSGYGCYDMAGNVFNWTTTMIMARNGAEKGKIVNEVRGGSWYANGTSAKASGIGEGRAAGGAYNTVGFRTVRVWPGDS